MLILAELKRITEMAGKTGTSQVKEITEEEGKEEIIISKVWNERDHALFVGYAHQHKQIFCFNCYRAWRFRQPKSCASRKGDILLACQKIKTQGSKA